MKNRFIQILQKDKIPVSWFTVYIGQKVGFLNNNDVVAFAVDRLNTCPKVIRDFVLNLAIYYGQNLENQSDIQDNLLKIIENLRKLDDRFNEVLESDKWRYSALKNVIEDDINLDSLLEKAEGIYCDFDHPEEMQGFISYMPPLNYDPKNLTQEECLQKMNENLLSFLKTERDRLKG